MKPFDDVEFARKHRGIMRAGLFGPEAWFSTQEDCEAYCKHASISFSLANYHPQSNSWWIAIPILENE
jgi:hypothetical protein